MKNTEKGGRRRFWRVSGDEDCPHESIVQLGSDKGNNEYYLCQECGAAMIREGKVSPEDERERIERENEEDKSLFDRFIGGSL